MAKKKPKTKPMVIATAVTMLVMVITGWVNYYFESQIRYETLMDCKMQTINVATNQVAQITEQMVERLPEAKSLYTGRTIPEKRDFVGEVIQEIIIKNGYEKVIVCPIGGQNNARIEVTICYKNELDDPFPILAKAEMIIDLDFRVTEVTLTAYTQPEYKEVCERTLKNRAFDRGAFAAGLMVAFFACLAYSEQGKSEEFLQSYAEEYEWKY